jgi:hypothetical protein
MGYGPVRFTTIENCRACGIHCTSLLTPGTAKLVHGLQKGSET